VGFNKDQSFRFKNILKLGRGKKNGTQRLQFVHAERKTTERGLRRKRNNK